LPYLLKGVKLAGQEATKKLGEKASEQGFEQAKALWEKLRPKVEARPAALEAAAFDNLLLSDMTFAGFWR
jgi:hypothetical protein